MEPDPNPSPMPNPNSIPNPNSNPNPNPSPGAMAWSRVVMQGAPPAPRAGHVAVVLADGLRVVNRTDFYRCRE